MKPNNFPVRVALDGSEEIYTQTGGVAEKFLLDDVKGYINDTTEIIYTIEVIDYLSVSFYAPFDMKINSITNLVNAPFVSIEDDGMIYSLLNTISGGSKVTVTVSTASVINLNITKA
jgi:hypothetical protein